MEVVGEDGEAVAGRHKEGVLAEDHIAVSVPVKRSAKSKLSSPATTPFNHKNKNIYFPSTTIQAELQY